MRLAYTRGLFPESQSLFVLNTRTGRTRKLKRAGDASDPAWSPDGRYIAYGCDRAICKIRLKDGRRTLIARPRGSGRLFYEPDWQPLVAK